MAKRIKDTSKKAQRIKTAGQKAATLDPKWVAEQLGAEVIGPVSPFGRGAPVCQLTEKDAEILRREPAKLYPRIKLPKHRCEYCGVLFEEYHHHRASQCTDKYGSKIMALEDEIRDLKDRIRTMENDVERLKS